LLEKVLGIIKIPSCVKTYKEFFVQGPCGLGIRGRVLAEPVNGAITVSFDSNRFNFSKKRSKLRQLTLKTGLERHIRVLLYLCSVYR
jgi:hypothetical protein